MDAPDPAEEGRLRTLRTYGVLDSAPEAAFDGLAEAAARVCEASMAAVTLVDATRQWFKAEVGLRLRETSRDGSFCAHAMDGAEVMVVPDARLDPRFRDSPLVTGEMGLSFYAGAAIRSPDGVPLGALCVMDRQPRPAGLSLDQVRTLRVLADQVEPQLRLRLAARASHGRELRLQTALESAEVGWWDWDVQADRLVAGLQLLQWLGLNAEADDGATMAAFLDRIHPDDRERIAHAVQEAVETGEPFREEHRIVAPDGAVRWLSARGRLLRDADGRPWRVSGVTLDVTGAKVVEERLRVADVGRELALEAARLGRFDHDLESGRRYYDARALAMLNLTQEQAQDVEQVVSRVHPEDRAAFELAQAAACNPERRGPYRAAYRIRDPDSGEHRWISGVGRTLFNNGVCVRFMGVLEDVTEAKEAERHRALLMREMNHRLKNTLSLVQALVDASLRKADDPARARSDIGGRIGALSRAHDLLIAQSWAAALIGDVVGQTAEALSLAPERFRYGGPPVELGPKPALQLSLVLHELATNAMKYGALSRAEGSVRLDWRLEAGEGDERLRVDWVEEGGPPVVPPTRQGFGSRLIGRLSEAEFGGVVRFEHPPEGVRWSLSAALANLHEPPIG